MAGPVSEAAFIAAVAELIAALEAIRLELALARQPAPLSRPRRRKGGGAL